LLFNKMGSSLPEAGLRTNAYLLATIESFVKN
jgi:hypothetical protein